MRALAPAVCLALLLLATARVGAQPALTPPTVVPAEPSAAAPSEVKSEGAATVIALGATAAGYALMAEAGQRPDTVGLAQAGVILAIVGPSFGHVYAGESRHALAMTGLRTAGLGVWVAGFIAAMSRADVIVCDGCASPAPASNHDGAYAAMAIGGLAFVGATAYDLYDAHRAARRTNARWRDAIVTPTVLAVPGGTAPGVALTGRW